MPKHEYQIAVSVQSLHHLDEASKCRLYETLYERLKDGGIFILQDRVALDADELAPIYESIWERLERLSPYKSQWSGKYFLERLKDKQDYPGTIENQLTWLRDAGFYAGCIHSHLDRAIFVARKCVK